MAHSAEHLNSQVISRMIGRREVLRGAALAFGALAVGKAESAVSLPTVTIAGRRVSRMISGGNPLFGYSHFNGILDRHMREYFTEEQITRYMLACEKAGITAWQSNYPAPLERIYPRLRDAGCKLDWFALADTSDVERTDLSAARVSPLMRKCIERAAKLKPVAIALRGTESDQLIRQGRMDVVRDFLNCAHDAGLAAGVSAHNPEVLEHVEEQGWPADYFMACFYQLTRTTEDFQKEFHFAPVGETFPGSDPERMCRTIRQVKKPCFAFKILAAGRRCDSAQEVRQSFEFALKNIKSTDALIVGMYPRFTDQIGENSGYVRELAA